MGGRYGGTMPKRGTRNRKPKDKQVPAMDFFKVVGRGTIWAAKEIGKATFPHKGQAPEGVKHEASGNHPVL